MGSYLMSEAQYEKIIADFQLSLSLANNAALQAVERAATKAMEDMKAAVAKAKAVEKKAKRPEYDPAVVFTKWFSDNKDAIVAWCSGNPLDDYVIFVPSEYTKDSPHARLTTTVIAGSFVVQGLCQLFRWAKGQREWSAEDADVFHLRADKPKRIKVGNMDVVDIRASSPEQLLLEYFDLPCCRAARNTEGDLWVSLQCLSAIATNRYFIPKWMSEARLFEERATGASSCGEPSP